MAGRDAAGTVERRERQRFVARRRGEYCFWVAIGDERRPLTDLSLEGFGVVFSADEEAPQLFDFVLFRAGVPDEIRGRARVTNIIESAGRSHVGCLFERLAGPSLERLQDWLVAHVIATASVPITEQDAVRIVSGPSLI